MELTQQYRHMRIMTVLGEDVLLLRAMTGREEISRLFRFDLDLVSEDVNIDCKKLVGTNVTFSVLQADDSTERHFNGFISRFSQGPSEGILARYHAEVVPSLWFLTRTADCRIFQQQDVPTIIKTILDENNITDYQFKLQKTYPRLDYCVQYRETAFNYIARLAEQYGIYFFFEHQNGKHMAVFVDDVSAHRPCEYQSKVEMIPGLGAGAHVGEDYITNWDHKYEFRSGKWVQTDYNYETPGTSLLTQVDTLISELQPKYEVFDYPGEYLQTGAGDAITRVRMEEEEAWYNVIGGESLCRSFNPGSLFTLTRHENNAEKGDYLITSVQHSAEQAGFFGEIEEGEWYYHNSFTCIPSNVQYRPPRITPKPRVRGMQTAVVTGPSGEEIYTNEYACVKVQFPWDRRGKFDERSSCWIRVSQPWAGKNWGAVWNPRIGQEVLVDFYEGDPDRPVIVGRVYNGAAMPPYPLPGNQTRSTFKSRSSKGGGGFNEIRFEDLKGSEQVFIHAQKDMDQRVKNDWREFIGNERHLIVTSNQKEKVGGARHNEVAGDLVKKIGGNRSLEVTGNKDEKVGGAYAAEAGSTIHVKAGMTLVVEAGVQLSLKVGGNFVDIGPAGVTIQGTMVKINSGGAAASGPGAQPATPEAPDKADDGSKGTKL